MGILHVLTLFVISCNLVVHILLGTTYIHHGMKGIFSIDRKGMPYIQLQDNLWKRQKPAQNINHTVAQAVESGSAWKFHDSSCNKVDNPSRNVISLDSSLAWQWTHDHWMDTDGQHANGWFAARRDYDVLEHVPFQILVNNFSKRSVKLLGICTLQLAPSLQKR